MKTIRLLRQAPGLPFEPGAAFEILPDFYHWELRRYRVKRNSETYLMRKRSLCHADG